MFISPSIHELFLWLIKLRMEFSREPIKVCLFNVGGLQTRNTFRDLLRDKCMSISIDSQKASLVRGFSETDVFK